MRPYTTLNEPEFEEEHLINSEFYAPTAIGLALARSYRYEFPTQDPLGMWTGNPTNGDPEPIQDADDL